MAAAVSSVWAKPGAWALEAEEHEAELNQQQQQAPPPTQIADSSAFPSLAAAATTKTKKKKPQPISLAEFASYGSAKPTPQPERLTPAEIVQLPTGPRERTAEELERPKGFRSYGSRGGDDREGNQRWGRGDDGGERRGSFNREPSRADENDNWGASKKSVGFERKERGSFFESSKADEVDSWVSSKPRFESGGERGGFFESSKADEVDSWVSSKPRFESGGDRFEKRGSFESLSRNRDSDSGGSWGRRREENVNVNVAGPGARPKLLLQPRTLPAPVLEVRPESPAKVESPVVVNVERAKGANPFGNARPREEVLAEKGQDWKEIEEKLEAVKMKEVAAVIEKSDEKSPGKMGFGLGNGRKDDRTERSWRKSTEPSEEGAQQEEPAVEEANKEEDSKEEAKDQEDTKEEAESKN